MKDLSRENNFKYIKDLNSFYGEANGYYFYSEPTQHLGLARLIFSVEENDIDQLKEITSNYRAVGRDGIRYEGNKLILDMKYKGFTDANDLSKMIEDLTLYFKSHNIKQVSQGKYENLGLYRNGTKLEVRESETFTNETQTLSKIYKKQSNSTLKGYLMAFVYALPGVIALSLAIQFGIIPSIVSMSIIYGALKGYNRYGGEMSKNDLIALFVLSFIMMMLSTYLVVISRLTLQGLPLFKVMGAYLSNFSFAKGTFFTTLRYFVIALIFNMNSIRYIFNGAGPRTQKVSRKIQKLL